MAKQVHDETGANQHIAPLDLSGVPPQPGMWAGPNVTSSGMDQYGPPENWAMGVPPSAAGEQVDPTDMIVPVGGQERLGAAYHIDVMRKYNEPANYQPTRATEFYRWTTGV